MKDPTATLRLDAASLDALEQQLGEQERRAQEIREKVTLQHNLNKNKDKAKLHELLDKVSSDADIARNARVAIQEQLKKRRQEYLQQADEFQDMDTNLYDLEQSHQVEKLTRRKMELGRLKDSLGVVDHAMQVRTMHLEAIKQERIARAQDQRKVLDRLMNKAETLRAELNDAQLDQETLDRVVSAAVEGASANQSNDHDDQNDAQFGSSLIAQVHQARLNRHRKATLVQRRKLSKLNRMRIELDKREAKISEKARQHSYIMSKGLDTLIQLELGLGPPRKVLLRNMPSRMIEDRKEGKADDEHTLPNDYSVNQIVTQVTQIDPRIRMRELKHDMKQLKREKEWSIDPAVQMKSYNGELDRSTYRADQLQAFDWLFGVVKNLAEKVLAGPLIDRERQLKENQLVHTNKIEHTQALLARERSRLLHRAAHELLHELTEEVVIEMVCNIHAEIVHLSKRLWSLIDRVALKAVAPGTANQHTGDTGTQAIKTKELVRILGEMQKQRNSHHAIITHETRVVPSKHSLRITKPSNGIVNSEFYGENDWFNIDVGRDIADPGAVGNQQHTEVEGINTAKKETDSGKSTKIIGQDDDEDDATIIRVDKVSVLVPDMTPPQGFLDHEMRYWSYVDFEGKHLKFQKPTNSRAGEFFTALAGSPDGSFLAVGTSLGKVLVWDLRMPLPQLIRKSSSNLYSSGQVKPTIRTIVWSLDGSTHLASLDSQATVRVFSVQVSRSLGPTAFSRPYKPSARPTDANNKPASLTGIPELSLLLALDETDFCRPGLNGDADAENDDDEDDDYDGDQSDYVDKKGTVESSKKGNKKGRGGLFGRKKKVAKRSKLLAKDLRPCALTFHPAHTTLGLQCSLVVGLRNGVIVKWNMWEYQSTAGADKSMYAPCAAEHEPKDPKMNRRAPTNAFDGQVTSITREFFQAHLAPIVFVGFRDNMSRHMVSMDEAGIILFWTYDPSRFSGFGWFLPDSDGRFRLLPSITTFKADSTTGGSVMFPESNNSEEDNVMPLISKRHVGKGAKEKTEAERHLEDAKKHEQSLAQFNLDPAPWLSKLNDKGERMQIYAPPRDRSKHSTESEEHHMLVYSNKGVLLKHATLWFFASNVKGDVRSVEIDPSGKQLVVLAVFSTTIPSKMRTYVLTLHDIENVPFVVEMPLRGLAFPCVSLSPILGSLGSDYLYVAVDGAVTVISLTTGVSVTGEIRPFEANARGILSHVAVLGDHEHVVMLPARQDNVLVYAIDDSNQGNPEMGESHKQFLAMLKALKCPRRDVIPANLWA